MTGTKTNERPGTRAQAKYVRVSASKARAVLDEIRGKHVADAADILDLSERGVSEVIAKVLDSAVSNAEHNDLQDADELFVSACYADEGPTLKRWRPRARGRATRINKRTCHITVIVSRMDEGALEQHRARVERRLAGGSAPKADRAARVAKSRGEEVEEVDEDEVIDDEELVEESADERDFGPDSHLALDDGSMPEGFPVKGNADSMKYHQPGGRWYDNTVAEVWFANAEAAEAAGFTEAGKRASAASEGEEE